MKASTQNEIVLLGEMRVVQGILDSWHVNITDKDIAEDMLKARMLLRSAYLRHWENMSKLVTEDDT